MLIKCKECGQLISDQAIACPHCGIPLRQSSFLDKLKTLFNSLFSSRLPQKHPTQSSRPKEAFGIKSMPYSSPYHDMNHEDIHQKLIHADSYEKIKEALSQFPSVEEGYRINLPWLMMWAEKQSNVSPLYVAHCLNDQATCASLLSDGQKFSEVAAVGVLNKFARKSADEITRRFLDRYVDFNDQSKAYYSKKIEWTPHILDNDMDFISYFQEKGVNVTIGDQGLSHYRHTDYNLFYSNDYESPLSKAVKDDDFSKAELLLQWGANPNQYLHWSCSRSQGATGIWSLPLICSISSIKMFDLMISYGMEEHPLCILGDTKDTSREDIVCSLLRGPKLEGKKLDLFRHLSALGYERYKKDWFVHYGVSFLNGNFKNNQQLALELLPPKSDDVAWNKIEQERQRLNN